MNASNWISPRRHSTIRRRFLASFDCLEDRAVPADVTAPIAIIDAAPLKTTLTTTATFAFHGEDAESGVNHLEYRLDTAVFVTGTSPVTFSGLAPGEHSFQVQAVDNAGNVSLVPATYTWAVQATSDSRFVERLYRQILNREPDEAGLAGWTAALGTASRESIVSGIWASVEHRGLQVDSYYQLYLGRAADPAGREAWVNQLVDGAQEKNVIANFVGGGEYQSLHPLADPFVDALYADLLHRPADPAGHSDWVGLLTTQSPVQEARGFMDSHERHTNLVNDDYFLYLGRVPSSIEAAPWVDALDAGLTDRELAIAILASQENWNLAQTI